MLKVIIECFLGTILGFSGVLFYFGCLLGHLQVAFGLNTLKFYKQPELHMRL